LQRGQHLVDGAVAERNDFKGLLGEYGAREPGQGCGDYQPD
jgi:hypothetical protein